MNYPKISIITPSFNQGTYIEQTIKSILDQKYPNLEYIIIDGGSTDNTVDIIKKYENHLAYWVSEPDNGQTDAINKGFAKCTGEIFNWINSDDYYEPGVFIKLAEYFSNSQIDVVCGKEWGFNDSDQSRKVLHAGSVVKSDVYETVLTGIIDQPCTFFRKDRINDVFPLNSSLRYIMDRHLWWGYLLKHDQQNILQTNDIFTNFRLHLNSKTMGEGNLFEAEFDRLKNSLLHAIKAPAILQEQVANSTEQLNINWQIKINSQKLLSVFSSYYATRAYVKDDLKTAGKLIKMVKRYNKNLSLQEKKIGFLSNVLPLGLTRLLKKIKPKS